MRERIKLELHEFGLLIKSVPPVALTLAKFPDSNAAPQLPGMRLPRKNSRHIARLISVAKTVISVAALVRE